jgi:hypothetical protein
MTKAQAANELRDTKPMSVHGGPQNYSMLVSEPDRTTLGLCHEKVTWIAQDMGHDLHAFIFQVNGFSAKLGPPKFNTSQTRDQDGKDISYLTATWHQPYGSLSIRYGLTPWGGYDVSLIKSAGPTDEAVSLCD